VAQRTRLLAASVWVLAIAATGCGGGAKPTAKPTAILPSGGYVVVLANAVCRDYYERVARAGHHPSAAEVKRLVAQARQAQARIRAIMTPAASRHPSVGTFVKDLAAEETLDSRLESPGLTQALLKHLNRARIKLYDDEKVIGLTACLGPQRKLFGG
jgi:hypothetical protein